MTLLILAAVLLYLFNALWLHAFTQRGLRRPGGLKHPLLWYAVAWGWPVVFLGVVIAMLYQTCVTHLLRDMPTWNNHNA